MKESDIENYLNTQVCKRGGVCLKFTSPGQAGMPDRFVALNGHCLFVELKRPGHKKRPDEKRQKLQQDKLRNQGIRVYQISTKQGVDLLMRWVSEIGLLPAESRFANL